MKDSSTSHHRLHYHHLKTYGENFNSCYSLQNKDLWKAEDHVMKGYSLRSSFSRRPMLGAFEHHGIVSII